MKTILALLLIPLSGCAGMDYNQFIVPDMLTRAISPNILYNGTDTGYLVVQGLNTTDAHVYSMVSDANMLARAMVARYNGDSNAEAMIQTLLASTVAGIGMAGGPVGAAGGMGIASMVLGRIFTRINSPAQANAFSQFVERNTELLNLYATNLKKETCSGFVSGEAKTNAGLTLEVGFGGSLINLDKIRQGLTPTIEQIQGGETLANARGLIQPRENCPQTPIPAARSTIR